MKILSKGQYYGLKDLEKSLDGIVLSQYNYNTGRPTDWHYHENPYFWYILNGNMMDCNKKVKTLCPPGSLMFTNWQEIHYGSKHSGDAAGFHLEFERSWLKNNDVNLALFEGSALIQQPKVHFLFAKLYYEFLQNDAYSKITIELLLLQICDALSDSKNASRTQKVPDWVELLKELIHYDKFDLSLKHLSEQLGVHPAHISRAVPKYLSVSLGEYIRQHKLKEALPLILDRKNTLTNIAHQAGFSDQSHFNRVFNSVFDMNPNTYRKIVTKNY
ncbi:helix-turn-helix transcriptional regulator [Algoriphagus chordae]|nr:helix-turn-helix transcriptional regulator [Algoriphagus chordae]